MSLRGCSSSSLNITNMTCREWTPSVLREGLNDSPRALYSRASPLWFPLMTTTIPTGWRTDHIKIHRGDLLPLTSLFSFPHVGVCGLQGSPNIQKQGALRSSVCPEQILSLHSVLCCVPPDQWLYQGMAHGREGPLDLPIQLIPALQAMGPITSPRAPTRKAGTT